MMEHFWTPKRLASLAVAAACVGLAYGRSGIPQALAMAAACLLPVVCVWCPEALSAWFGYGSGWFYRRSLAGDTPPVVVSAGGWILLAALLMAALVRG